MWSNFGDRKIEDLVKCLKLATYKVLLCLGWESNPYGRFGPRDFKSLVSTIPPPRQDVGLQR